MISNVIPRYIFESNFKSILFHEFNSGKHLLVLMGISQLWKRPFLNLLIGLFPLFTQWHNFLCHWVNSKFKFELDLCSFCNSTCETLQHLFFSCPVSANFWLKIHSWLSFKINDIPSFDVSPII